MKKALVIPLTDQELQEVYRILIDLDKDAARVPRWARACAAA